MVGVVIAVRVCIHLIALIYSSCCGRERKRLGDVSENRGHRRNIITYHSFLIIGFSQVSCLSARGMLVPIDARATVRIRVVRLATFIFAGFKDRSKLWGY